MTWTAPDVKRSYSTLNEGERSLLESMLDQQRQTLLMKCSGLEEQKLKIQPLSYSNLSLLGLVRHMADVELFWFRFMFNGDEVPGYYHRMDDSEVAWEQAPLGDAQQDFANYAESVRNARDIALKHDLDATFTHFFTGEVAQLRYIYVHLIQEYARHCGHADVIRQAIDGETGE